MSLEPGPELDALVAEKVMGWEHVIKEDREYYLGDTTPGFSGRNTYWVKGYSSFGVQIGECVLLPKFSTSIAAAWEVVEKLRTWDDGYRIGAYVGVEVWSPDRETETCCEVNIEWHAPAHVAEAGAIEATAPHAICLAALRAVGVEI